MNNYKNVYVTGSIAYDTIMDFPGEFKEHFHSEKLHQINVSFVVKKLEKQLGGTGTNISYNVSQIINKNLQITNKSQILNNKINGFNKNTFYKLSFTRQIFFKFFFLFFLNDFFR